MNKRDKCDIRRSIDSIEYDMRSSRNLTFGILISFPILFSALTSISKGLSLINVTWKVVFAPILLTLFALTCFVIVACVLLITGSILDIKGKKRLIKEIETNSIKRMEQTNESDNNDR